MKILNGFLVVLAFILCLPAVLIAVISFYVRGGDAMGAWLIKKVKSKMPSNA